MYFMINGNYVYFEEIYFMINGNYFYFEEMYFMINGNYFYFEEIYFMINGINYVFSIEQSNGISNNHSFNVFIDKLLYILEIIKLIQVNIYEETLILETNILTLKLKQMNSIFYSEFLKIDMENILTTMYFHNFILYSKYYLKLLEYSETNKQKAPMKDICFMLNRKMKTVNLLNNYFGKNLFVFKYDFNKEYLLIMELCLNWYYDINSSFKVSTFFHDSYF